MGRSVVALGFENVNQYPWKATQDYINKNERKQSEDVQVKDGFIAKPLSIDLNVKKYMSFCVILLCVNIVIITSSLVNLRYQLRSSKTSTKYILYKIQYRVSSTT